MTIFDDGSNVSVLIVLGAATLLGALAALVRAAFLPAYDQNTGVEVIPLRPNGCTCGDSWCDYVPNKAQKKWWTP